MPVYRAEMQFSNRLPIVWVTYRAVWRSSQGGWPIATTSRVPSSVYSPSTNAKQPSVYSPSPGSSCYIHVTWFGTNPSEIGRLTSLVRSSSTLPSASSTHNLPSLLWESMPKSKNRSPALPRSCFVDFSVTRCWRSRDGNVEGAKCSLRRTLCLIILSLFRTDRTRESAEPEMLKGPEALKSLNCELIQEESIDNLLFKATALYRPVPERHIKRVDEMQMTVRVKCFFGSFIRSFSLVL